MLFWLSLGCIAYTYAGYPLVLIVVSALRQLRTDWRYVSSGAPRRVAKSSAEPTVAVLVAAYNEERHIEERVRNATSKRTWSLPAAVQPWPTLVAPSSVAIRATSCA